MKRNSKMRCWSYAFAHVTRLSTPLVMARLISALNGFGGMLLIAQLGHQALAAGALISAAFNTIMVIVWGLLFSVGVMVGRAYGAADHEEIGRIFRASMILSILISIPAMILMWYLPELFLLLKQPREEVILARAYFHPASFMILPSLICVVFSQLCMAIHQIRLVLIWTLVSLPLTLILAYLLLWGYWGLPALGIAGVAWANVISWTLLFFVISFYFYKKSDFHCYHLFRFDFAHNYQLIKKMLRLGLPISVQFGGELAAFAVMTVLMGLFGSVALAAQQIVVQISLLVTMISFGISQAVSILISQAMGAKQLFLVRKLTYSGFGLALLCMLIIGLIYYCWPNTLIAMYLHGQSMNIAVKQLAVSLFIVMAFVQIFDAMRHIATGALRGLHDTKLAMYTGLFVMWCVGIPLGAVLAFPLHWGPVGLPAGFAFGFLLGALFLMYRLRLVQKSRKFN